MPPKKTSDDTGAKKAPVRKATPKHKIESEISEAVHHVEENTAQIENNSKLIHILYILIIILIAIVAALAFFVGKYMGGGGGTSAPAGNATGKGVEVTIIDDSRCTTCQTDEIVGQLESLPFLSDATFERKDFTADNMSEYMENNDLASIPAVIFSTNSLVDGGQIVPYLSTLPSGDGYSLALPATFDPFAQYSPNGYLVLEKDIRDNLLSDDITYGYPDAQITWLEYSDMECPFCAKLHNDGTQKTVSEKYGDGVNYHFHHFPLDFHPQAEKAAESLECMADQNPENVHDVIVESYAQYGNNDFDYDGFLQIGTDNGYDIEAVKACVEAETHKQKVADQMETGQTLFSITGTPGNVLINNATGEYVIISGAYPAETFEAEIDKMLTQGSGIKDEDGNETQPPSLIIDPSPEESGEAAEVIDEQSGEAVSESEE